MDATHRIGTDGISATIKAEGAELVSLQDAEGQELLWQAGPEWPRHAPVIFPIVGRLAGDLLHHGGRDYRITQHGFARDSLFEWTERSADRAILQLEDDDATRALFPFRFRLEMIFAVEGARLSVTARVTNPGDEILPCGVGAHPGFRWPLVDGVAKTDHRLVFDEAEAGPVLSVEGGLLAAPKPDLPFEGRVLPLAEDLFARDALVMPGVRSRGLRYEVLDAAGEPRRTLTFSWQGFKDLGIWSKPSGAPFLCVEPWYSMASPVGWDGEFTEKPGILTLAPGGTQDFTWTVAI